MECRKLSPTLDFFGYAGVCIGPEKCVFLKNSLLLLTDENHFKKTYYWGRINGGDKDYYIAYGYGKDCLKSRVYFYSTNCIDWGLLPQVNKQEELLTPLVTNFFQGDPSTVSIVDTDEILIYNNDEKTIETYATNVSQYKLKEEDRLAATVKLITDEAMIIPRGSWIKQPNGNVTENTAFEGLNLNEMTQLKSYLHARLPRRKWATNLLTYDFYNYAFDFLDSAKMDVPKECWILQPHLRENLIIIRNMYWPGMTFYHQINSPDYGWLYVGSGIKNFSMPFMIGPACANK